MVKNIEILALDLAGTVVEIAHTKHLRHAVSACADLIEQQAAAIVIQTRNRLHPNRTYPLCVAGNEAALTLWGYCPADHGPHYPRPDLIPRKPRPPAVDGLNGQV